MNESFGSHAQRQSSVHATFVLLLLLLLLLCFDGRCGAITTTTTTTSSSYAQTPLPSAPIKASSSAGFEYLWYEAENMRGLATDARDEPILNPSWMNAARAKTPGWGINGPGVSAEWSQGGESEWNSVAASADETGATLYQDIEVPRAGTYKLWVRYADWANKTENFAVTIMQGEQEVFRHQFGQGDVVDPHDETSMYWGWAFTWATPNNSNNDSSSAGDGSNNVGGSATSNNRAFLQLAKGRARVLVKVERSAEARRHVDALLITNDVAFVPEGRRKPDFAALRFLREWSSGKTPVASLLKKSDKPSATLWQPAMIAGRAFLMPWNISAEFWKLYDKPPAERPLYPFSAEPIEEFVAKYKGSRDVPIFASELIVPVIYINELPQLLKEGTSFLRYLRETHVPFAVLINYGTAQMPEGEGQAAWKLLTGELREQFIGWISGESVGHVWSDAATRLKLSPAMSRSNLLEAYRDFYTTALERKWNGLFHTPTGAMWDKLITAQSTSSTAYAHALARWGSALIGIESSAVQPLTAMRVAFTRGAARQYNRGFLYYHAPNFGDTATTFTQTQNFAGPNNFLHSRYGATMGPSLAWYRKSFYLYYMAGASAIYLEQGFDQFFKPGPGDHPFQLNPLGRITDEFVRFADKHPARGTPYTPIAFLLDPAHGWDMTDYPHLPFGVAPIQRSDRALRELFGASYYPGLVVEGEPATGDRQAFVSGIFGDIFDVIVASETHTKIVDQYRAVIVGGQVNWSSGWGTQLERYVRGGGTVVLNAAQAKGLPSELLGVGLLGETGEADDARCLLPTDARMNLSGQAFRYERISTIRSQRSNVGRVEVLIETPSGDPLVIVNRIGRGQVILCLLPDLLGLDERLTPFAAHLLTHIYSDVTPVDVRGEVQHLINRTDTGWVVTLINNQGVYKPQQGMAQVVRSEMAEAVISLRTATIESAREWTGERQLNVIHTANNSEAVRIQIAPGGVAVVELREKRSGL